MKIAAYAQYKAIPPFDPVEIPALTVLTGLNGSGKSQLLNGLLGQNIRCDLFGQLAPPPPLPGMPAGSILPVLPDGYPQIALLRNWADTDGQFDSERASKLGDRFGNANSQLQTSTHPMYDFNRKRTDILQPFRQQLVDILEGNLEYLLNPKEDPWRLGTVELSRRAGFTEFDTRAQQMVTIFLKAEKALKEHIATVDPVRSIFLNDLQIVEKEFGVTRLNVTHDMIETLRSRISVQMFKPNIVELFSDYRDRVFTNDMDEIQARRDCNKQFLDHDKFVAKYGPAPWETVTQLLSAMGLPFEVVPPSPDMAHSVRFRLRIGSDGEELSFVDLSSGEQVLLRFAVSVMRPNPAMVGFQRPLLLLLDEMDASLHPEMVQRWLSAIERGIVGELGIHVILTTHSPTTVALAPNDAIFAMVGGRPHHVSKQEAINKLTFGVPTLSIDYSGRRQVFCESDTDAAALEKIYSAIKPQLLLEKELNFIGTSIRDKSKAVTVSVGDEMHAGEAVVRQIVENLASRGVSSVFGLIDWDAKAVPTERVHVISAGTHYTIENILLDPLLIGMLMVLDRMPIPNLQMSPRALDAMDARALQQLADKVQNVVVLPDDDGTVIDIKYLGGASVRIRKRYASINGHVLESILASTFGPLKRYTANRGVLARRIAEVVITDYPEFCPQSVANAFQQLSAS
jgi:ABC-type uncharacterized transport system ATPase component